MLVAVYQHSTQVDNPQTVQLQVIPDTGATKSVISLDLVTQHGFSYDRDLTIDIITCSEEHLKCEGLVTLFLIYEGRKATVECLVSSSLREMFLLCWKDLQSLGVLQTDFPQPLPLRGPTCVSRIVTADEDKDLQGSFLALLNEFNDVFENLSNGRMKTIKGPEMHITLKKVDEIKPIKCLTARRVPIHLEDEAKKEIQSLLDQGIIQKQTGATEWISPSFFVAKSS